MEKLVVFSSLGRTPEENERFRCFPRMRCEVSESESEFNLFDPHNILYIINLSWIQDGRLLIVWARLYRIHLCGGYLRNKWRAGVTPCDTAAVPGQSYRTPACTRASRASHDNNLQPIRAGNRFSQSDRLKLLTAARPSMFYFSCLWSRVVIISILK